ncbi:MAG TPA: M50 family metallopeptidase, partial [Longimicrobiales bacterium]|nr:M50 family metallopeptidase [Longimicrobiales bacterium]
GRVAAITLDWRQGGATYTYGGNAFVMLSAGYLGSLLWGLALLAIARSRPRWTPPAIQALGMLTVLVTLVYVRNGFGVAFGIVFGGVLFAAGRRLKRDAAVMLLTALGLTSALYALLDIRSDIIERPGLESDAHMLAELTGIPTLFWGFLWAGIALASSLWLLHRLWRGGGRLR